MTRSIMTRMPRARLLGKLHEVAKCAVVRIDLVVVLGIVPMITVRRRLKRHEPERRHAQTRQVVEAAHQPLEITHPVAVSIHI